MSRQKIRKGSPQRNVPNESGVGFFRRFSTNMASYPVSRKQCILDTKLLQKSDMKPYASYRMVSLSMTLSDPWTGFQRHGSFKRRISPKRRILQLVTQLKGESDNVLLDWFTYFLSRLLTYLLICCWQVASVNVGRVNNVHANAAFRSRSRRDIVDVRNACKLPSPC